MCDIEKELTDFPKCSARKSGRYAWCRTCSASKSKDKRDSNPDHKELKRQYTKKNPIRCMLTRCKTRAKAKSLPFNLTFDDFIVPEVCPILGIPLFKGEGNVCDNSPSIDRIIPELGYVKGNIQIISYKANTMKSNASVEELLIFAKWITSTFKSLEVDLTR